MAADVQAACGLLGCVRRRLGGRDPPGASGGRDAHERLAHLGQDAANHLAVGGMARFDGDEVALERPAQQREIAQDVEHLVAHEFLRIAKRLIGQHRVVADDHCVLEAAALDEPVADEELDLLVETERARVRQVPLPGLGRHLEAVVLGETAFLVGAGAGDLEALVRKEGHHAIARLQFDRGGDGIGIALAGPAAPRPPSRSSGNTRARCRRRSGVRWRPVR